MHYLDDFCLLVDTVHFSEFSHLMADFLDIYTDVGVPLAKKKTIGLTTLLIYLGLEINKI